MGTSDTDRASSHSDGESEIDAFWPDGAPAEERLRWDMLAPEMQTRARRRLIAIQGVGGATDTERRFATIADAATYAEMGLSTFYVMLKRWSRSPSLASIGVNVGKPRARSRAVAQAPARLEAEHFLQEQLSVSPGLGTNDLLRRLGEAGHALSKTSAVRLIQKARRDAPIISPFGQYVAIDSAGLDMVAEGGTRLRLHMVLDVASGLVLGWTIEDEGAGIGVYERVAQDALDRLGKYDLGSPRSAGATLLVVRNPPGDHVGNALLHRHLQPYLISPPGMVRATGALIVQALGERVAGIGIGTGERRDGRSYRSGRPDGMPVMSDLVLKEIDAWIGLHNQGRLARLPQTEDAEAGQQTLQSIRDRLSDVIEIVKGETSRSKAARVR